VVEANTNPTTIVSERPGPLREPSKVILACGNSCSCSCSCSCSPCRAGNHAINLGRSRSTK
jgi:hypothetical protein